MTKKEEIIRLAKSMDFKLDYDKSHDEKLPFLRFTSIDDKLDEPDLRWVWRMNDDDNTNILDGQYIQKRLAKKKQIQEFLKY